jgi:hypothetical protein
MFTDNGAGLTALKSLNLSHTSFTIDTDTDLSGLFLVEVLDLRYMPNLVGSLNPAWFEQMPKLKELLLSGNSLTVRC